ncbi:MAG TPA: glycosyltransferase family 39 protein [Acidimicrobiia bacterium]|nr:glycosyltransferase family 39 protein [Acidimicrobiia bacterium]
MSTRPLQPARFSSSDQRIWHKSWFRALIIFTVAVAVRIPFRAIYLVNWDSVNFALGVETFNLETHQPHPPGYLGYVLLGRLIDWIVGDPVVALTAISIVAGAVATAGIYLLAIRIVSERAALIAAGLFGTSPLVWYYSEVALTYIVEVALALPLAILVLEARRHRRESLLLAAAVLLALMGAVRQTSLMLFLPLLVYGALAFPAKVRIRVGVTLGGLVTIWLIPLLVMSGGPLNYLRLSAELAELTGGATWLGAGAGVLQNVIVVSTALALGMHVALVAIPLEIATGTPSTPIVGEHRRFLAVWGIPPLLTYLLIHSGQMGYVLVLLPIGIMWAAKVFDSHVSVPALRTALVGVLLAVNGLGFFILPEIAYATVSRGQVKFPEKMATDDLVKRGIQQISLPRNDAYWSALLDWIDQFDSDEVVVLAEPRDGGSFRHLSFYRPDLLIYGLGNDRHGTFGYLFTSANQHTDYNVESLDEVTRKLDFPDSVHKILIPDPRLQERLEDVLELDYEMLETGDIAAIAEVPGEHSIRFVGSAGIAVLPISSPDSDDMGQVVDSQELLRARYP